MNWEDATSYSKGQRGKQTQTAWQCKIDGAKIWVSCDHRDYPNEWVMSCDQLDMVCVVLGSTDISSETARDRAITDAWHKARQIRNKMDGLADSLYAIPPTKK